VRAEVVTCAEGRVIVSRIAPIGDGSVCLELHRGEKGKATVTVTFMILTTDEAQEVGRALAEIGK
jgi:hypothetical protein